MRKPTPAEVRRFHELTSIKLARKLSMSEASELKSINAKFDAWELNSPSHKAFNKWMRELDRAHRIANRKLDRIEQRAAEARRKAGRNA